MKIKDLQIGATYVNKGAGRTRRKILAIGVEHRPTRWLSSSDPPLEPGVLYEQDGKEHRLYISSFAQWCGAKVPQEEN